MGGKRDKGGRQSPAPRKRLTTKLMDSMRGLLVYDIADNGANGSPEPGVTAMVHLLHFCMSFVRIGLAHMEASHRFDAVMELAREQEVEGWETHRAQCPRCGGQ
jgi:hypothetical protein